MSVPSNIIVSEDDIINSRSDETHAYSIEDSNVLLQVPKKKTARRSLESQFETCVQPDTDSDSADGENDNVDVQETKQNTSSDASWTLSTNQDLQKDFLLKVPNRDFINLPPKQIYAASSTESIVSNASSKRRNKSPSRNPSFIAAISGSLVSNDELRKKDIPAVASDTKIICQSRTKYSATPKAKSVTSLPPSPYVPNQTSTPTARQIGRTISNTNTIESDGGICRICHDGEGSEELISPCYCTGSVGGLHLSCLERWLGTSNTTRCEICKYEFKVERKPRSLIEFLRHPASSGDRKNMICDLVCFLVLTPLTVCSAFLCMMGIQHYNSETGSSWEVPGLASLTACLMAIYTIWCGVATKHHINVIREWRSKNQVIKIIYLSPTKGKTVLCTHTVKDDNNNNIITQSPSHVLDCRGMNTPTAINSLCGAVHSCDTGSRSYHAAMLRPILRYSSNLQILSSEFESPASLCHGLLWGPDHSDCGSNPLLCSHGGSTQMMAVIGQETYV